MACWRASSVLLLLWFQGIGGQNSGTSCTKQRIFDKDTKKHVELKTRCAYGCCGTYPKQYCCTVSIGVAVGGLAGAVGVLCLLVIGVCCCAKKMNQAERTVEPGSPDPHSYRRTRHPHQTNINVVYGEPFGSYPGFAWGRPRRIHPIKPPPYRATEPPPPPYSVANPAFDSSTIYSSLPGCSGNDLRPSINPFTHSDINPISDSNDSDSDYSRTDHEVRENNPDTPEAAENSQSDPNQPVPEPAPDYELPLEHPSSLSV